MCNKLYMSSSGETSDVGVHYALYVVGAVQRERAKAVPYAVGGWLAGAVG